MGTKAGIEHYCFVLSQYAPTPLSTSLCVVLFVQSCVDNPSV